MKDKKKILIDSYKRKEILRDSKRFEKILRNSGLTKNLDIYFLSSIVIEGTKTHFSFFKNNFQTKAFKKSRA